MPSGFKESRKCFNVIQETSKGCLLNSKIVLFLFTYFRHELKTSQNSLVQIPTLRMKETYWLYVIKTIKPKCQYSKRLWFISSKVRKGSSGSRMTKVTPLSKVLQRSEREKTQPVFNELYEFRMKDKGNNVGNRRGKDVDPSQLKVQNSSTISVKFCYIEILYFIYCLVVLMSRWLTMAKNN